MWLQYDVDDAGCATRILVIVNTVHACADRKYKFHKEFRLPMGSSEDVARDTVFAHLEHELLACGVEVEGVEWREEPADVEPATV